MVKIGNSPLHLIVSLPEIERMLVSAECKYPDGDCPVNAVLLKIQLVGYFLLDLFSLNGDSFM